MTHLIGHVDADSFYAAAERVRYPWLKNKPVGVLGNQGAAVIARSYEMREYDVPVGMPIWEAKRRCPSGVYIKRDFRWYEVLSRQMLNIVHTFSPQVEYYSIDECFFELVPTRAQTAQQQAEALRDTIWKQVGIPVSVGIGRSRTLAKLISDFTKPFGALAIDDIDFERWLLEQNPVNEICGIARRRAEKLAAHGIHTALDYAFAPAPLIRKLLTIVGERLWYELNGEPVIPLHTTRPPHKMLSRGGSIGKATDDPNVIYGWLVRTLERLIEELDYYQVHPSRLEVWVEHYKGGGLQKRITLPAPTARFDQLLHAAREGLSHAWIPGRKLHRLHLIAQDLHWPGHVQQGLFEQPDNEVKAVAKVKREINQKLGRFTIRSGATLFLTEHYQDEAWSYEICDVRGKTCF